ncbi:MAG TPA: carboxypeptidase-like regulatory domain-containing protein [Puia sp.]|nr:carboxypeptidase-like regulatory domain-containing protein [Puia sp.]
MRISLFAALLLPLLFNFSAQAQKKGAFISGKVLDENETGLGKVSVIILGKQNGIVTSDSGTFRIKVPAEKAFALQFSFTGYRMEQRNFLLNENEHEQIVVRLERNTTALKEVTVTDQRDRNEAGLIKINPKDAINIPTPNGGIESLIKIFVGSNNELTSQYSVRGGSYDENLIYINDFEVFRPYLVSNAQQEGLSIINPDMTKNVSFYNGGFQAKYGDKMSSVLDIQYKKPKSFGGSVYMGLLEQGFHLEGTDNKCSYLIGVRNRTNKSLLSSQETIGDYSPSSSDAQALLTYQFNEKNSIELMGIFSQTKFTLIPQSAQLTASVFSPFYTANLGLDITFEGEEKDSYQTNLLGLTFTQQLKKNLRLKWMVSRFDDNEKESYDIIGNYLFGERDFDNNSATYGLITNPLGAGIYQNYARNRLDISVWNATHKGYLDLGKHFVQWGVSAEEQVVNFKLLQWNYEDSAGYSLPYMPGSTNIYSYMNGSDNLNITRFTGFVQDNIAFKDAHDFTLQAGVRYNYNNLNNQFLVSPRMGFSWKPKNSKKDIVYRAALGIYDQPPFFREMIKPDGTLNKDLKAQLSYQATAGLDYNFKMGDKPFRLTTEAYYKYMTDVDPYDINNVHIQYFGLNDAKAYAAGVETRLFGEFIKDAESWFSIGFMRTKEKIANQYYYNYTLDSLNQPTDSVKVKQGWVRRPTDRLLTLGMFVQDYLSTNKNFKVYLNLIYGSNLPFNIPGSVKYRNALTIPAYIRADLGFSALLLDNERDNRRSHSPFRNFQNIWATLEVFNVIDKDNTISYLLIKDFSNTTYAMPQRLTPRLLNFKIVAIF